MPGTFLEYNDGHTTFEAYVALPTTEASKRPAVLVSHAWAGRSAFECGKADKLAALGYVGVAIDTYGKGVFGNTAAENSAMMMPLVQDRALLRALLRQKEFPWSTPPASAPSASVLVECAYWIWRAVVLI